MRSFIVLKKLNKMNFAIFFAKQGFYRDFWC